MIDWETCPAVERDPGTPVPWRRSLPGHAGDTVFELGWATLRNGDLLNAAGGVFGTGNLTESLAKPAAAAQALCSGKAGRRSRGSVGFLGHAMRILSPLIRTALVNRVLC